jgi:hypothetical protein
MDNGNQNFKKKIFFMSKNLHSAMCHILMHVKQSMTLTLHHGCSYNVVV